MPDRDATQACVGAVLQAGAARLAPASDSAFVDAQVLLCHVLGVSAARLYTHPEQPVPTAQAEAYADLLARRAAGEPVAYLTARREFWSLELEVTPATLIPRPETEILVETALAVLADAARPRVVDLGTGSGAIALALARERPAWALTGLDRSLAALEVAARNRRRHGLDAVGLVAGDWCAPLARECFDLVVSNPPYVAAGDPHLSRGDVRFEPGSALLGGADGLDAIRHLAESAPPCLAPGGLLLVEHGLDQGPAVRALFLAAGLAEVRTFADLGGRPRATLGRRPA